MAFFRRSAHAMGSSRPADPYKSGRPADPHKSGSPADSYKMLLIGETGSGKTSFLNFLCNAQLVLELGFDDTLERFRQFNHIHLENPKATQMESKTSDATLYPNVKLAGDLEVGLIDTPGFGDSRGIEEDKKNAKRIVNELRNTEFVNCICLIINGTVARMSATLKYVLTEVSAILPKRVLNNIIVVFTNTSDLLNLNFDPSELRKFIGKEIEEERIFVINNPFCQVEKAKSKYGNKPSRAIARSLKKSFDEATQMLTEMCSVVKTFEKVYTHHFIALYETKEKIDEEVADLFIAFENEVKLNKKIQKAQQDVDKALREKNLHSNYHSTQIVKEWIRENTARHNTLCGSCFSNCHVGCNLEMSWDPERFKACACIQGVHCNVCGHHYTDHYHAKSLHKLDEKTVEFIDKEARVKFEGALTMEERARVLKQELNEKKKESEEKKKMLSAELLKTIEQYQDLGITRSYARVLRSQLSLVEQRLEGADTDQYKDLEKTKNEIEAKLQLVEDTLREPFSPNADPVAQNSWACTVLGVHPTASKDVVERAYRTKARASHPDKASGDDETFKRVEHARNVLLRDKS